MYEEMNRISPWPIRLPISRTLRVNLFAFFASAPPPLFLAVPNLCPQSNSLIEGNAGHEEEGSAGSYRRKVAYIVVPPPQPKNQGRYSMTSNDSPPISAKKNGAILSNGPQ